MLNWYKISRSIQDECDSKARKRLPQAAAYLGLEAVSQVIPAEVDEPHVKFGKEFVQQLNSIPAFFASLA